MVGGSDIYEANITLLRDNLENHFSNSRNAWHYYLELDRVRGAILDHFRGLAGVDGTDNVQQQEFIFEAGSAFGNVGKTA